MVVKFSESEIPYIKVHKRIRNGVGVHGNAAAQLR